MQWLLFWLVYPILWLISKLPFWLFYKVSDFVCFIIYRIIGYRKDVVRYNLKMAFPERSEKERRDIEKRFYSHMCDMFLEMIKSISISNEEIQKRYTFPNVAAIKEMVDKDRSVFLIMGHYANFEWMMSGQLLLDTPGYGVYKRIKSKPFDKLAHDIRERWNAKLLANKDSRAFIQKNHNVETAIYGLITDQAPRKVKYNYVTEFFGHKVPFFRGVEGMAKKFNMPVFYIHVEKIKRGHYQATFKQITDDPQSVPDYEITEAFVRMLEAQIKNAPEYYLWTHKRFKHIVE